MRDNVAADGRCGYTGIVYGIREAMRAEIERCMELWGSAGRADAVLAVAESWKPVHHVIIYNVIGKDDTQVLAMMQEGKRVLSGIPGVRRVTTGKAVREDTSYRFSKSPDSRHCSDPLRVTGSVSTIWRFDRLSSMPCGRNWNVL